MQIGVVTKTKTFGAVALATSLAVGACSPMQPDDVPSQRRSLSSIDVLRSAAEPIATAADYDPIIERAQDDEIVLLGEASHGTEEFYRARAAITRRLVREQGYDAVVLEADWPAAERIDRYVRGLGEDESAEEALGSFERFPQWMWKNTAFAAFITSLRELNQDRAASEKVRVFGMDLYSATPSSEAVIAHLTEAAPQAAIDARLAYGCFLGAGDPFDYGVAAATDATKRCDEEVARPLAALKGLPESPERFSTIGNARVVKNAEAYYRTAVMDDASSWNLRDRHMVETLGAIRAELAKTREEPKIVVWAHNSHLGDARATAMSARGELNVGQLARERWGEDVLNVGFTTYDGKVRAAPSWDAPDRLYEVNPGREDSYEGLFHQLRLPAFVMVLDEDREDLREALPQRLERAIGVIYRPATERWSHYFEADLLEQFDIVVHFDRTTGLRPLPPEAPSPAEKLAS